MPKVSESYKKEKALKIIEATIEVLNRKPLYEITMFDIIKAAGLSKGGIYLYFNDLDTLLVEAINMISKQQETIEFLEESQVESIESSFIAIFIKLGDYIDSCPTIIGKIRFELMIYISNNPEKAKTIMSRLQLKNIGSQFMESVEMLLQRGVKTNTFRKDLPFEIIIDNIAAYIDGISDQKVSSTAYGAIPLKYPTREYFLQYAQSQIAYLKNK